MIVIYPQTCFTSREQSDDKVLLNFLAKLEHMIDCLYLSVQIAAHRNFPELYIYHVASLLRYLESTE